MTRGDFSDRELEFIAQRDAFLELARKRYPHAPRTIRDALAVPPGPIPTMVVSNLEALTAAEVRTVGQRITETGFVHLVPQRFDPVAGEPHPLLGLAALLRDAGVIGTSVDHPMEGHPEAVTRFGDPDGTLKLYDLPVPPGADKYREQAETNDMFDSHNDGLGYAGLIRHVIMTLDSPPLAGGYTYFTNLVAMAQALANTDPEAFDALFLPDAITAVRPRGKGAIKVASPVFFVGRYGDPQVFFRISSGEYRMTWRDLPALNRAQEFLRAVCAPFGPGSKFVHLMRPGETVVVDNSQVVHGRTSFTDPPDGGRVLARKWFVQTSDDSDYRHVPGIAIDDRWAHLFPEHFSGDAITGEWHFDERIGMNVRVR